MKRRSLVIFGILFATIADLYSAAPKVDAIYPAGGRRGETVAPVLLIGKLSGWPVSGWASHPGIRVEPEEKKNRMKVHVGKDVPVGPHLVRVFDQQGASEAKVFVVSDQPEVLEYGLNEQREEAEEVKSLPLIINGRLERNGDTDFYKVKLQRGQLFTARLDGYSLGSQIDPFINLLDPRGYEIQVASDTHNLDPYLQYRVAEDGEYQVQIFAVGHKASTSVSFSGAPAAVYRLHLTLHEDERLGLPLRAEIDEGDLLKSVPVSLAGVIAEPGQSDEFSFPANKGEQYTVRVEAQRWRYVWDPVLAVSRPDGRVLREVDDSKPSADPDYTFKAGEDGAYKVAVTDRFRSGGAEHRYRLVIEPSRPRCEAAIDKDRFELKPGKSVDLKLKIDRQHGHAAELTARVENLPPGINLEAKPIDAKAKTATLTLKAAADAAGFNGAIRVLLASQEGETIAVNHSFITGESRGDYLVNETADLWLTVLAAEKPKGKKGE